MKRTQDDWYRHPKYYEAIFGTGTRQEMDFLEAVNVAYGTGGSTFLEPACGAGRLIEEGARRGLHMVGYDTSPEMLDFAKQRLKPEWRKRVELHLSRMETFAPEKLRGRIDLAFSLVSTFRYLDSEDAALAHLVNTRQLLRPGGVYVLGFHLTDYAREKMEHERWVERLGPEEIVCNTREWPPDRRRRRSRMRNRLSIRGPNGASEIETNWFFRTWNEPEAEDVIAKAGYELVGLYTFDADITDPITWDSDRLDRIFVLAPAS